MADDEPAVSVRELRSNLSRYLERAHDGERIVVTRSGRADCQLGPLEARRAATTMEESGDG